MGVLGQECEILGRHRCRSPAWSAAASARRPPLPAAGEGGCGGVSHFRGVFRRAGRADSKAAEGRMIGHRGREGERDEQSPVGMTKK